MSCTGCTRRIGGMTSGMQTLSIIMLVGLGGKLVNCPHARIASLSSGSVILCDGSGSNIRLRMLFSSSEIGSIDWRNERSRM
jgi:hypothetical protein